MDVRDAELLAGLMRDCRAPMRVLAERLDISVAAAHKRVTVMEESGVVKSFVCLVHPALFGGCAAVIHGESQFTPSQRSLDTLSSDDRVFQIVVASGNHLHIRLVLRSDSELDAAVEFVAETLELTHFVSERTELGPPPGHELTSLDCAIALGLRFRARRPVASLAQRLAVSEKVVRRRLDLLYGSGSLMLLADVDIGRSGGQWARVRVQATCLEGVRTLSQQLPTSLHSRVLWRDYFGASPHTVDIWTWSHTVSDVLALQSYLLSCEGIKDATVHLSMVSMFSHDWIDAKLKALSEFSTD